VEITILPKDYIITMTDFNVDTYFSDFMLRALRIQNTTGEPIEIKEISYTVKKNGQVIKNYMYSSEALKFWIPRWSKKIQISDNQRAALIGAKEFWDYNSLSKSTILEPGEEIGLRNEYFHIMFDELLDELLIQVKYTQGENDHVESRSIDLVRYENKNKYTFPVKGTWKVDGNFDCLLAHRGRHVDEFAFDLTKFDKNHMVLPYDKHMKEENFAAYGEEVYAIADGVVVQVYENMKENTIIMSLEEQKKIEEIHGYWPVITGNVVTIQHEGGEHSQYDHLQYHSVNLKVGEKVKQGQVIGQVGNTGMSGSPHLHFELTSGFKEGARSFPCFFTNIKNGSGQPIEIITEEYTVVHAE
jgi:hypothetical protein